MIIGDIRSQQTSQMALAEDDDVVQTLAPNGSDQSFRVRILPRTRRGSDDFLDAHRGHAPPEAIAIDGVAIPQEPSRGGVIRKGFDDFLRRSVRGGVLRDPQMNDASTMMGQQHEHEHHASREGRYGEEVQRHQRRHMIREEGAPGL